MGSYVIPVPAAELKQPTRVRPQISHEQVIKWFDEFQRSQVKITPHIAVAIAAQLESVATWPIPERSSKEWPGILKNLAIISKEIPDCIQHWTELAARRDEIVGETRVAPEWLTVNAAQRILDNALVLSLALAPRGQKHSQRSEWHVRAVWAEDIIRTAFKIHAGKAPFSTGPEKPFVRVIGHALKAMGCGNHGPSAISKALRDNDNLRLVIQVSE